MNKLRSGSVLLPEDIDSAGIHRKNGANSGDTRADVSLSGLLNALDGPTAPEGHIVIMTTYAPEELDPALVRAGRVDFSLQFKNASRTTTADIFIRMMSDDSENSRYLELKTKAREFTEHIPEDTFSPAEIQGYLIDHARDVDGALSGVGDWISNMIAKRAEATKTAEEDKIAHVAKVAEANILKLLALKKDLEQQAVKEEEQAAAALARLELETKTAALQARKLRAEAEINRFKADGTLGLMTMQDHPMTPSDSDDEPLISKKARNKLLRSDQ